MNALYAKCILYAYPGLEKIIDQTDTLVMKKALASMTDFRPCVSQCESILELTERKQLFIELKLVCDSILKRFTAEEMKCLDYRYFQQKPKEIYDDMDKRSRGYYRKQTKILEVFRSLLEESGMTDEMFEKRYLVNEFLQAVYKRVNLKEQEELRLEKMLFLPSCSCVPKRRNVVKISKKIA